MGYIADVVANTPILSTWGNLIRNRVMLDFTNAAERSSQWTTPPEGAHSFLRDNDRVDYYDGANWKDLAGAKGEVAMSTGIASTGNFASTLASLTGISPVGFVCSPFRIYRVEFDCLLNMAAGVTVLALYQDGAQIQQRNYATTTGVHLTARVAAPLQGLHTWSMWGSSSVACQILAGANFPWLLTVTDMGPTTP